MKKITSNTTIALIKDRKTGKLIMAGDRRLSLEDKSYIVSSVPKVYKREGILLGASGDSYLCWLLTAGLTIPPRLVNQSVVGYMMYDYLNSVTALLQTMNFIDPSGQSKLPEDMGCDVLIGIEGMSFLLNVYSCDKLDRVQLNPWTFPYAIGCGGDSALASLKTTENSKMKETDRLRLALSVAAELNSGCDDNIDIIKE